MSTLSGLRERGSPEAAGGPPEVMPSGAAASRVFVMPPRLRKLMLTVHITTTVGWLGAVVAFIALAIIGLNTEDDATLRAVFLVMEPLAWYVLVPLAFASLLTGIVQAVGTQWGLVRHYWIFFKLVITAAATAILVRFADMTGSRLTEAASSDGFAFSMLPTSSPLQHAMLALGALLVATGLAVYKPRAVTPFGRGASLATRARWMAVIGAVVAMVMVLLIILPFQAVRELMQLLSSPIDGGGGGMGH